MPGTTFLPVAGPLGTLLGVGIGALVMLVIGFNYHYLMNRYQDAGGSYTYTKEIFGYDHGFLNAWFLILTYVAIIWANATALPLIARNLFGKLFQFGYLYEIAGYQIYVGEVLLSICALIIVLLICFRGSLSVTVQTVMAGILFLGIAICFIAAIAGGKDSGTAFEPPYSPDRTPMSGIITIIALAPWAFVGFESISHTAGEFKFGIKKSLRVIVAAVVMAGAAYAMLAVMAACVLPEGYGSWFEYISDLGNLSGREGLPTFNTAGSVLGTPGLVILGITALGAIVTGLVGNTIAASRLIYSVSRDRLIPDWIGRLNKNGVPKNAVAMIIGISVILPFLGRTAISWIVDVTTVGAAISYAYTSACTFRTARKDGNRKYSCSGLVGLIISLMFLLYFLIPNLMGITTLSTESYLILAAWGIGGFICFLLIFRKDRTRRLGRTTAAWIVLLALIIYTSTIWMRQSMQTSTRNAVTPIQDYYVEQLEEHGIDVESGATRDTGMYIYDQLNIIGDTLTKNSLIQIALIIAALVVLFMIYNLMQKREKQIEVEKALAEESSRAKSSFLSNMSHEIRTPMNAIIGLDNIALRDPDLSPRTREQLEKIGASARHLLGLINDILDMSRIESGRMVLKNEEFSFHELLDQVNVIVNGQCDDKGLTYECRIIGHCNDFYYGDDLKLKQVMINILGNAVKFTPAPGKVTLTVEQTAEYEGYCILRFSMKDTGIGMSKEFIPQIFDAFSQESTNTINRYGSTGLGMAITKNIVEMMNGDIEVESEKGKGTTFIVTVSLKASNRSSSWKHEGTLPEGMKALVIDDDVVACEHAQLVANAIGIETHACTDPVEGLELIREQWEKGTPFDLVLSDYKMPGMDGMDLCSRIHEFDEGKTAVIILTGYNWEDMQEEAKAAGVDAMMAKPLFTDSLMRQIQNILNRKGDVEETGAEEVQEGYNLEGLRVLIAEEMEINAEILADLQDLEGIESEHAENGQIAVDMFSQHPENYYDAVLMDVRMPVMDGLTAAKTLRALDRPDAGTIPIIAMTANAFDEDVQKSLQAGMSAHLSKPVDSERLYETLGRLTGNNADK